MQRLQHYFRKSEDLFKKSKDLLVTQESSQNCILQSNKGKGLNGVPKCSLVSDCSTPDLSDQQLTKEQLSPLTESYSIESKEEAFHPKLQEICLKNPITLVEKNPNLSIKIRKQIKYASDEN
ncbi:Lysine-specific demethylase 6B [Temnothorax longispinosus]|uniref:Lysine-specific demethylase 6B n=1 Tax=Temnothorax longispinosus TaxID=300112 RepID=A0A4S2KW76_9HYME|nr:Lysine-specific demethylase 6B [Temnothorax longispinosus]